MSFGFAERRRFEDLDVVVQREPEGEIGTPSAKRLASVWTVLRISQRIGNSV